MTDTFILFTAVRKQQIDHLRERLMTERPYTTVYYGDCVHRIHPLGLTAYVIYAALRGADYRKGDHTGGKNATQALKEAIHKLNQWLAQSESVKSKLDEWLYKWIPKGHGEAELKELVAALTSELAKWQDAPVVPRFQHVPAAPLGNFIENAKSAPK